MMSVSASGPPTSILHRKRLLGNTRILDGISGPQKVGGWVQQHYSQWLFNSKHQTINQNNPLFRDHKDELYERLSDSRREVLHLQSSEYDPNHILVSTNIYRSKFETKPRVCFHLCDKTQVSTALLVGRKERMWKRISPGNSLNLSLMHACEALTMISNPFTLSAVIWKV